MKRIKLLMILVVLLCCNTAFAKINVRLNAFSGPVFSNGVFILPFFPESLLLVNYEFEVSEKETMAIGADMGFMFLPYLGLNYTYSKCLQPDSEKKYRWNIEAELHGGLSFMGNDYVNMDGTSGVGWEKIAIVTADVLFTRKPKDWGFYFGLGPSFSLAYMSFDRNPEYLIVPGLFFTGGVRF